MNNKNGIGFFAMLSILLTIVFVVLKLTGVVEWNWIWVLSPIWIYAILFLLIMSVLGILIVMFINKDKK